MVGILGVPAERSQLRLDAKRSRSPIHAVVPESEMAKSERKEGGDRQDQLGGSECSEHGTEGRETRQGAWMADVRPCTGRLDGMGD